MYAEAASNWISLEDNDTSDSDYLQIRQVGWAHAPFWNPGGAQYCAFYALGTGQPHAISGSCGQANSTFGYVEVYRDNNFLGTGQQKIVAAYCGTGGGYAGCTAWADYVPQHLRATASAEAYFPPAVVEAGNNGNKTEYGHGSYNIELKDNVADAWNSGINLSGVTASSYSDYMQENDYSGTQNVVKTWDDRNDGGA